MDVVYVVGTGSLFKDWELRFSLRSIEKYLSNYDRVFIIGHKPDHVKGIEHIPFRDTATIPDENILNKLIEACKSDCSEEFLFMNDDHYLLDFYDATEFPFYYQSTIADYLKTRMPDQYTRRMANTAKVLESLGKETKNFDIHTPIIYNKAKFQEYVVDKYNRHLPDGMVLKSLYGNQLDCQPEETTDNKSGHPPIKNIRIFSTMPRVTAAMQRWLLEEFPYKSRFEV